jgi:nucleoside-diphosphate-sugar epimerase
VNILTNLGYNRGEITVFGGEQLRPNIHIGDMVDVYLLLLAAPAEKIDGKVFNAGYENHTVMQLAAMVQQQVGEHVKLTVKPTNDPRSYHVSSRKIRQELGFTPEHSISQAVGDLIRAFNGGKLPNSLEDPRYFNIKMMQRLNLT